MPLVIGLRLEHVRGLVEEVQCFKGRMSNGIRAAVEEHVRPTTALNVCSMCPVTRSAAVLTARGRGMPGVRARVVVYQRKLERCVFHETLCAEALPVQASGARLDPATLECKLTRSFLY